MNNVKESILKNLDPTMISQLPTTLIKNLAASQADALSYAEMAPILGNQDGTREFACELFKTNEQACVLFSQYCDFGTEGCKTREDKELLGYPSNPIKPDFKPMMAEKLLIDDNVKTAIEIFAVIGVCATLHFVFQLARKVACEQEWTPVA